MNNLNKSLVTAIACSTLMFILLLIPKEFIHIKIIIVATQVVLAACSVYITLRKP